MKYVSTCFPFRRHRGRGAAWGVNGFASVLAAPLAVATAMTYGYRTAGMIALALYLVPTAAFARLPSSPTPSRASRVTACSSARLGTVFE